MLIDQSLDIFVYCFCGAVLHASSALGDAADVAPEVRVRGSQVEHRDRGEVGQREPSHLAGVDAAAVVVRLAAALGPGRVYTGWLEGPVRRTDLARLATASAASSHALGHLLNHSDRQANVVFAPPVPVEERQLSPVALSRVPVVAAASLTKLLAVLMLA